ncbi:MAG: hypothetical protein ACRC5A_05705 [Enterobacteriaceae bacterium]
MEVKILFLLFCWGATLAGEPVKNIAYIIIFVNVLIYSCLIIITANHKVISMNIVSLSYCARVFPRIVSLLLFVTFCSSAQERGVIKSCSVPETLTEYPLLMHDSEAYSPSNPNAGILYKMIFYPDNTYRYVIMDSGKTYNGSYSYRKITDSIGLIEAEEIFETQKTHYKIVLLCENTLFGTYAYQQQNGVGGHRNNSGRYYVEHTSSKVH